MQEVLTKNIRHRRVRQYHPFVKIQLYNTYMYFLPVLLFGSEMWDMTAASVSSLDAFDEWCLRHILQVPFAARVTNEEVCLCSAQPPVTQTSVECSGVSDIVRSDSDENNTLASMTRRRSGVETTSWSASSNLAAHVENGLKQQNLGLWSAL